jgi:hypothetical protein
MMMLNSNDLWRPVFFIDMEGTILSTVTDNLLDRMQHGDRKNLKDFFDYVKSKGFQLNDRYLVLRPGIKTLLLGLRELGKVVLFSGAKQCEVNENVNACGLEDLLDGWFGSGSGLSSSGWPLVGDGGFCLIDDSYSAGKLSVILDRLSDDTDMERHLIKVDSFNGDSSDLECHRVLKMVQSRCASGLYYSVLSDEKV